MVWDDLLQPLTEAAGGRILAEVVLDRLIATRLAERGHQVSASDITEERGALLRALDDDPEVAERLMARLQRQRGLGRHRVNRLLARNAGLRALVEDRIEVPPQAVRRAYDRKFGKRYEARLIVTGSMAMADDLIRKARAGESFTDLAIASSLDPSGDQGGLLPLISPADPTFPAAIRDALNKMQAGQISNPIMLEKGFAILRLERIIEREATPFEQVSASLTTTVRERITRQMMRQFARSLLTKADIVILDPVLNKAWEQQRATAFEATE